MREMRIIVTLLLCSCAAATWPCRMGPLTNETCTDEECNWCHVGCQEGQNCEVTCEAKSCRNMVLNCADSTSCLLECNGRGSCANTIVKCPADGSCSVSCTDSLSCANLQVLQTSFSGGDLDVACLGEGSCAYASFECPASESCDFSCEGKLGCKKAYIRRGHSGATSVSCKDNLSCGFLSVKRPWGLPTWARSPGSVCMNCTGFASCASVDVDCAGKTNCVVDCQDKASCALASLEHCDKCATECDVLCRVPGACRGVNLPTCNRVLNKYFPRIGCKTDCVNNSKCDDLGDKCPDVPDPDTPEPRTPAPLTPAPNTPTPSNQCRGSFGDDGVYNCIEDQCQACDIPCPEGAACNVRCAGDEGSCRETRLDCTRSTQCSLACEGIAVCSSAVVTCPQEGSCVAECLVTESCISLSVQQSTDAPAPSHSNTFSADCMARSACERASFECPRGADCSLSCTSETSCADAAVLRAEKTDLQMTCSGFASCELLEVRTRDAPMGIGTGGTVCLNCTGSFSCAQAGVACSDEGNCLLDCRGRDGCADSTVSGCNNATCQAVCTGEDACSGIDAPLCDDDDLVESELCLWECGGESNCTNAPSSCPHPTCRHWLPLDPRIISYEECMRQCPLATDSCLPESGVEQLCECEDVPPSPVPLPEGWHWSIETVFRSSFISTHLMRDFISEEFETVLLYALGRLAQAAHVLWVCPQSACKERCPLHKVEKQRRGCVSLTEVTSGRHAALLSTTDEPVFVEYSLTPSQGISDEEVGERLQQVVNNGQLGKYGMQSAVPVQSEVAVPDAPVPRSPDTNESKNGLSTGGIVGIVAGCVLLAGVVAGVIYQRSKVDNLSTSDDTPDPVHPSEQSKLL